MKKRSISMLLLIVLIITPALVFSGGQKEAKEEAVTLTIWHDKGEKGIEMLNDLGELFQKKHPNVKIESNTFPSQTFIEKSIASINTNTAPDVLYNDWFRIIPIELQTGRLLDLTDAITEDYRTMVADTGFEMGFYNNKQIVYPHEISYIALGIRKSWLEKVNGKIPETFDDFIELAKKFTYEDPDGNGKDDTFGYTGYFGKGSLEILRYFTLAAGMNDLTINQKGEPSFNEPRRKEVVAFLASLYKEHEIIPKDAISHTYIEMYQLIDGSKVGLFRVGDWNVKKWDKLFEGDYIITQWPIMSKGDQVTTQLYTMRGGAVPENAPHKDLAIEFVRFCGEKEPQEIRYSYFASVARDDLELENLSENQKYFLEKIHSKEFKKMAPDTHTSKYLYAPKVEELYEKAIQKIIMDKDADIDKIIAQAQKEAWEIVKRER